MSSGVANSEEAFWARVEEARPGVSAQLRPCAPFETSPGLELARAVDASGHGLGEWLDALVVLYEWVHVNPRGAPWSLSLGYVGCASDYARSRVTSLPLAEVVRDFLQTHGFDGSSA